MGDEGKGKKGNIIQSKRKIRQMNKFSENRNSGSTSQGDVINFAQWHIPHPGALKTNRPNTTPVPTLQHLNNICMSPSQPEPYTRYL